MKTILTAFLCALFFAFPALAGQPTQPTQQSAAAPAQATPDFSTELKLQQQKIDFFKERLDLQDKRIGDLGMFLGLAIALFGALITAVVVFFSLKSNREAVQAAKDEARKEIEQQAGKVIGDWIDQEGIRRIEEKLEPEIKAAIQKVHEAASPVLCDLAKETKITQQLNQQYEQTMAEIPLRLEKLTQSEIRKVGEDAKKLDSIDRNKFRSLDWLTFGIKAYHDGKYDMAADYFEKSSAISTKPLEAATALLYRGITLGQMRKNDEAIAVYDEVAKRYGEAPEAVLREQVAKALFNKGVTLSQMEKNDEAIAVYDEVAKCYGDAPEAALREPVAQALNNKGVRLGQMGKSDEAIAVYDEVAKRYGDAPETGLREEVAQALNGKGFRRLCEAKKRWQAGDESAAGELLKLAREDIESALARKPDWPVALGNRGYVLFLQGHAAEAEAILAQALRLGGEELRQGELADADIHPLPQDQAFKKLINSLPCA